MGTNTTLIFIRQIARLTMDGECSACGKEGDAPNPECAEHGQFKMDYADAVETVHSLVIRARELVESRTTRTVVLS